MIDEDIRHQLEAIASDRDFTLQSYELTDTWSVSGVGVEAVEPVLRFMEEHPSIDFGSPGPLVHFVERFHRRGYEEKLVDSVKRKPTVPTVSMLNRLINGTTESDERGRFITIMEGVTLNPHVSENTLKWAQFFLERLSV